MRGDAPTQATMLTAVTPAVLVLQSHPIRRIKPMVDSTLQLKSLGYEDRITLTGKDGGPVKVDTKTQHVFQPSKEVWDEILRKRAEFEKLRDGDTDDATSSDSGGMTHLTSS